MVAPQRRQRRVLCIHSHPVSDDDNAYTRTRVTFNTNALAQPRRVRARRRVDGRRGHRESAAPTTVRDVIRVYTLGLSDFKITKLGHRIIK